MPEGHTIHRLARQQTRLLRGQPLTASSPQGRATDVAATLDGRVLEGIDPYGKHLLYRFAGDVTLHVHLGLYGRFTRVREPRGAPRLRLVTPDGTTVQLTGPTACHLMEPPEEDRLLARLGPDPLRRDADPERAFANLRRRRIPIGAALLDQAVLAGVGNVYRAEALHVRRLDPFRPAREHDREELELLWGTIAAQLADGVKRGRIRTDPRPGGRHFVYRRTHCATCDGPVQTTQLAARTLHWCPRCQRATG